MKKQSKKLPDIITENESDRLLSEFTEFGSDAYINDDAQRRILSSVMRKAGFEMKDTMKVNKTRRHGRRFMGILIAAAVLAVGSIGAAAYGASKGFEAGLRPFFGFGDEDEGSEPFSFNSDTQAAMDNISVYECKVLKNDFEGIDITFEGAVAYRNTVYAIFTLRRSDSQPFVRTNSEYEWRMRKAYSEYDYLGYQPPFFDNEIVNNVEDGSLTIMIDSGEYDPDNDEENREPLKFGFEDLYLIPYYHYSYENGDTDTVEKLDGLGQAKADLFNAYHDVCENSSMFTKVEPDNIFSLKKWSGDPLGEDNEYTRRYSELDRQLTAQLDELAADCFKGSYEIEIDTSELNVSGKGNYYDQPFAFNEVMFDGERPDMKVHYKNGKTAMLSSEGSSTYGGGWTIYYGAEEPLLVDEIDYLRIGYKKITLGEEMSEEE